MKKNGLKTGILLLTLAAVLLLTGFAFGSTNVELKTDEALIDLDLLVRDSLPGKYGNPETGLSGKTDGTAKEGTEAETLEAENGTGVAAARVSEIRVVIRDTKITVNDVDCPNAKAAAEKVKTLYRVGLKVHLVDDYAEYNTYRDVFEKLKEENISMVEETAE